MSERTGRSCRREWNTRGDQEKENNAVLPLEEETRKFGDDNYRRKNPWERTERKKKAKLDR